MAIVTGGVLTTGTVTDERPKSWGSALHMKVPDDARLITVMSKMSEDGGLTDPEHNEFEVDDRPAWDAVNNGAGYTAGDTAIVVDNGSYFRAQDIIVLPRTGEHLRIDSVSSNTLTVTRGFGSTSAAAIVDNDPVLDLGNAMPEASSIPTAKSTQITKRTNYSQILRESVDLSRTMLQTYTRPGDRARKRADLRMLALRRVKHSMERSALFGEAKEDTSATQRAVGGILEFAGNTMSNLGTFDIRHIELGAAKVFDEGSPMLKNKILLIGPGVRQALHDQVRGNGHIRLDEQTSKKYGFEVETLRTPSGELKIVLSSQLVGSGGTAAVTGATAYNGYGGYGIIADMSHFRLKYMQPLVLKTDRQANDYDGVKEEFLAEWTIARTIPTAHCVLKGWTF